MIYGISADAEGNFFLAGKTSGSIDSAVDNAGEHDHAVMKIDTEGDLLWTWQVCVVVATAAAAAAASTAWLFCCFRTLLPSISCSASDK